MTVPDSAALKTLVEQARRRKDARAKSEGAIVNNWDAATAAVNMVNAATARNALAYLLALHLHDLEADQPMVAMRNLQIGDVIELYGAKRRVTEILRGFIRTDGRKELFSLEPDVRVPLIERTAQS
jgi:hypothetical protein